MKKVIKDAKLGPYTMVFGIFAAPILIGMIIGFTCLYISNSARSNVKKESKYERMSPNAHLVDEEMKVVKGDTPGGSEQFWDSIIKRMIETTLNNQNERYFLH